MLKQIAVVHACALGADKALTILAIGLIFIIPFKLNAQELTLPQAIEVAQDNDVWIELLFVYIQ